MSSDICSWFTNPLAGDCQPHAIEETKYWGFYKHTDFSFYLNTIGGKLILLHILRKKKSELNGKSNG